jgi:hypothetical protein
MSLTSLNLQQRRCSRYSDSGSLNENACNFPSSLTEIYELVNEVAETVGGSENFSLRDENRCEILEDGTSALAVGRIAIVDDVDVEGIGASCGSVTFSVRRKYEMKRNFISSSRRRKIR